MTSKRALAILVGGAVTLTAACGSSPADSAASDKPASTPSFSPPGLVETSLKYVTVFGDLEALANAEAVAIVQVTGEERGEEVTVEEITEIPRILTLRIDETVAGSLPSADELRIKDLGYVRTDQGEFKQVAEGAIRLEVGDRALVVVQRFGGTYALVNHQSAYLLADGEVVDTERKNALIKELEKLSENDLRDKIKKAKKDG
jgi:hypothetical protein